MPIRWMNPRYRASSNAFADSAPTCRSIAPSTAPAGLRTASAPAHLPPDRSIQDLGGRRFFAFCGIGNPDALDRQLRQSGPAYVGRHWFPDHHAYDADDLAGLAKQAGDLAADLLVTTEKDWVKVAPFADALAGKLEIWRLDVELRFPADGYQLFDQVRKVVSAPRGK